MMKYRVMIIRIDTIDNLDDLLEDRRRILRSLSTETSCVFSQ